MDSFFKLGIVKNSSKRNLKQIDLILEELNKLFCNENINKLQIVNILKKYLSNFDHIETGKNLDQKM